MTTNYVCISRTFSIKQAMRSLIAQASENDNISNIYVEDEEGHFYGVIDLQKLIIARAGSDLEELIQTSYPFVFADEKIGECIEDLKKYEEDSIPVLNRSFEIEGVTRLRYHRSFGGRDGRRLREVRRSDRRRGTRRKYTAQSAEAASLADDPPVSGHMCLCCGRFF